jgi:hypothetical protein
MPVESLGRTGHTSRVLGPNTDMRVEFLCRTRAYQSSPWVQHVEHVHASRVLVPKTGIPVESLGPTRRTRACESSPCAENGHASRVLGSYRTYQSSPWAERPFYVHVIKLCSNPYFCEPSVILIPKITPVEGNLEDKIYMRSLFLISFHAVRHKKRSHHFMQHFPCVNSFLRVSFQSFCPLTSLKLLAK